MSFSYPSPQPCSNIKDPDIRREIEKLYEFINTFLAGQDGKSGGIVVVHTGTDESVGEVSNNDLIADPQTHTLWHYDEAADTTERYRELGGVLCAVISGSGPTYTVQRCSPADTTIVWGKQFAAYDVNGIGPAVGDGVTVKWVRIPNTKVVLAYFASGAGASGFSGYSGFSGSGISGYSGFSGKSGFSGAGGSLSNQLPVGIAMTGGTSGTSGTASRGDHQHDIANQGAGAYRKGIFFDSTGEATVDYMRAF